MKILTRAFLIAVWISSSVGQNQKNCKQKQKPCVEIPSGESCLATYYSADCTKKSIEDRHPSLYRRNGVGLGTPNLTIVTTDRNRGPRGPFSDVNITIYPDQISGGHAFEVGLDSVKGWRYLLVTSKHKVTPSDGKQARTGFSFPLKLNMYTNITVWSLPKSSSSRPARDLIQAGEKSLYPAENSSLWNTKIFYKKHENHQLLNVQFQPAPESFGIRYYDIQLRNVTSRINGISDRTTTHAMMEFSRSPWINVKFKDVKPGEYRINVKPFDDLSEDNRRCRCKRNGDCFPCTSTETETFNITHKRTQENSTDPNIKTPNVMGVLDTSEHSSLPMDNSRTDGIFDEDIGGSQGSGNEWEVSVSVLSVLGIAFGAVVSIFAVVQFKRGGSASVSRNQCPGPSVTIIHDTKHLERAQGLVASIRNRLHISVESKLFKKREQFVDKNSELTIFVIWMTPGSFSNFERRLLKNKKLPYVTLLQFQRQIVVIESQTAKSSIHPRIQYWKRFIIDSELDLFLDFLRNNTTVKGRESWSSNVCSITDTQGNLHAFKAQYSRMDSGIQSDYENETEFVPYDENIQEEYVSMAAVTITECHLDAPMVHQNKTAASFPRFNFANAAIFKHIDEPNGLRKTSTNPCVDGAKKFLSPEAMSCYDGSLLSEEMMVLNQRNTRQKTASEDSLSLIEENMSSYPTSKNRRRETPICFHNITRCSEKEEFLVEVEEDEHLDAEEEDDVLDEVGLIQDEDTISIGGQSC
ncbi:uncharacterized protein LOC125661524 [Ostrea edulis]|uniref:uncharacterized protein LOC125661524 n=1 Tax=Ostrea edulis TaxID=37623 RepID=UPI0024AFA358|nr:uncharacterized protein LOC125661524 [Ostrea edulis]